MDKIVREISDLYELSLSVGIKPDAQSNCEHFLSVLLARKNLAYAAVWIRGDQLGKSPANYYLQSGRPKCKMGARILSHNHPAIAAVDEAPIRIWAIQEAPFQAYLLKNQLYRGHFAMLRLTDAVVIHLQASSPEEAGFQRSLRQVRPVLHKFALSLERTLAYQRIQEETRRRKEAQELAEQAQQRFLANVSHEIRTPMNAVLGMVHLLGDTNLDSHQQEYLEVMRFASDNLMDLINNILDASKIEAGEIELDEKPFDLHRLLYHLHQSWQLRVKDKPVRVIYESTLPSATCYLGDSMRLQQILNNLLSNASKFTASGTICLRAGVQSATPDKAHLRLQISDTGAGIPKAQLPHIFRPFKQGSTAGTPNIGGTGLGLSIVRELLHLMGGSIEVESEVGQGTAFTIQLSLKTTAATMPPDSLKAAASSGARLKGIRVLVVEDNLMNQKLALRVLEKLECQPSLAPDGQEAVRLCQKQRYDLILMDIHMPKMDGLEAAKRIRAAGQNQETPIIALTAAALLEERNRGLASGMNDFITKPFAPANLRRVMLKWLDGTASRRPSEAEEPAPPGVQVDLTYLRDISGGDEQFVQEMLGTFLEELPNMVLMAEDNLRIAYAEGVYDAFHRLKPNLGMLGLKPQEQECAVIERLAKAQAPDWKALGERCAALLSEVRQAEQAVQSYYSKIPEER